MMFRTVFASGRAISRRGFVRFNSKVPEPRSASTWKPIGFLAFSGALGYLSYQWGRKDVSKANSIDSFPLTSTTKLEDVSLPDYCSHEQLQEAVAAVKKALGDDRVYNTTTEIEGHSLNEFSSHVPTKNQRPKYVVYATTTEEVSLAIKIMYEHSVPVVPFCGGTSLEGNFHSTRPGIVLDTLRMNKILDVHYDDLDAVVQAGVSWQDLNEFLEPSGLMFGPDCGPNGRISGMVSTNASGINASRYGAMIANVISLTVVLPDGTIVKTRNRPRKTSAGYNLTGLFVGSEGTLGVVTEATVKLQVKPKYETVVVTQFDSIKSSTDTVAQVFRAGIHPNAIELLDKDMMHTINYSGYFTREWLEVPTLFFKIGGINKTVVDEHVKELKAIAEHNNCQDFIFAQNKEEEEELFAARKNGFYAMLNYGRNEIHEDVRVWVTDIAVPLSRLSDVLEEINHVVKSSGFESIIVGHLGDGNFHADLFYTQDSVGGVEKVVDKMVDIGLANEGTCTGEHGVGNSKREFLTRELLPETIALMRKIKMAIDPKRILNPDKIFKIDPNDSSHH